MADVIGGIVAELSVDNKMDAALVKAQQAMKALESDARKLKSAMDSGAIGAADYMKRIGLLSAQHKELAAAMQSAYSRGAVSSSALAVGMNGVAAGGMNAGQKMMILGQVVDDAQYGMVALTNQAGQVAMALGLGAGMGGAVMALGVGFVQLTKHWHEFSTALGMSPVETAAAEMDRLGAATGRTAEQTERLNRLKAQEATWSAAAKDRGPVQAAGAAGVKAAIEAAQGGGHGFEEFLSGTLRARESRTEAEQTRIADAARRDAAIAAAAEGTGSGLMGAVGSPIASILNIVRGGAEDATRIVDEAVDQRAVDRAKALMHAMQEMAGTAEGEAARKEVLAMLEKAGPAADPTGMLAESIRAASPEGQEKARAERAQFANLAIDEETNRRRAMGIRQRNEQEAAELQAEQDRNVAAFGKAQEIKLALGKMTVAGAIAAGKDDEATNDLVSRHGRRLAALMAPEVRQSRVMDAAQLNASVQASVTNGPSAEERRLIEVRDEIRSFKTAMRSLGQPVKPGGR